MARCSFFDSLVSCLFSCACLSLKHIYGALFCVFDKLKGPIAVVRVLWGSYAALSFGLVKVFIVPIPLCRFRGLRVWVWGCKVSGFHFLRVWGWRAVVTLF